MNSKSTTNPGSGSQSRNPSTTGSKPQLASIVTTPLIQPSSDPDTGLSIFPRLPEDNDAAVFTDSAAASPVDDKQQRSRQRTLSGRFAEGVRQLFRTSSTPGSPAVEDRAKKQDGQLPPKQPTQRKDPLSGGHVYCKHCWDDKCKCLQILTLMQGDYCTKCWEGKCPGKAPSKAAVGVEDKEGK